ncbi:hypothetical protein B296_00025260 [Ensete ventricosum]|uniref:Uncharacterized protein n=1 Tax=Ensete ventricosum TaxID=4639 RepID=A0A426ZQ11_ENSVE|nr:hypothetical protein B296_00025260 [Ensete ventricosum]
MALSGGGFILIGRRVIRTLGLTSTITSSVVALYGESVGVEAWHEGMARHAAFMTRDDSLTSTPSDRFHFEYRRDYGVGVGSSPTQMLMLSLSWSRHY